MIRICAKISNTITFSSSSECARAQKAGGDPEKQYFQANSPGSPRCQRQRVMMTGVNHVIYFCIVP